MLFDVLELRGAQIIFIGINHPVIRWIGFAGHRESRAEGNVTGVEFIKGKDVSTRHFLTRSIFGANFIDVDPNFVALDALGEHKNSFVLSIYHHINKTIFWRPRADLLSKSIDQSFSDQ